MLHPSTTPRRRRGRPAALLAVGVLLAWTIAGCSSGDDSASTTSTSKVSASSNGDSNGSGDTEALATACREANLAPVETAAADFADASVTLEAADSEAAVTAAAVTLLDTGSALFSSIATALDDFFTELAQASGQSAIADIPDDFRTAADDFSALATDINDAGTVTEDDIATIEEVGQRFDELGSNIESGSPGGDELRRVPACETLIRNFEGVFATLEGDSGSSSSGGDGVNTDPSDGSCDQDRWLQDPDCGDEDVINSDRADGVCDDTRFFTDPDC